MKRTLVISFLLLTVGSVWAQSYTESIAWGQQKDIEINEFQTMSYPYFDGANYTPGEAMPLFTSVYTLEQGMSDAQVSLTNEKYESVGAAEIQLLDLSKVENEIKPSVYVYERNGRFLVNLSLAPYRKNPSTGRLEKLTSFTAKVLPSKNTSKNQLFERNYATNSVLSSGNWYKIKVSQSGIYKITRTFLKNLGIDVSSVDPRNIRIYGNGGGMLPIQNSVFRYDDLVENPIYVSGENDGTFNSSDYILFYGDSPHQWSYYESDQRFHHAVNIYSDYTYYFINVDQGPGMRIEDRASSTLSETSTVTSFDDFRFHESESVNIISSGRLWYGEYFDNLKTRNTVSASAFSFPNRITSEPLYVKTSVIASSTAQSSFVTTIAGQKINLNPGTISGVYWQERAEGSTIVKEFVTSSTNLGATIDFNAGNAEATGYLDYIEMNVRRQLKLSSGQMIFRDSRSVDSAGVSKFEVSGMRIGSQVWEITDPTKPYNQLGDLSGSDFKFSTTTDSLREFIAFDGSSFLTPLSSGKVANQNLHGFNGIDMVIISHPNFMTQAQRLADFHIKKDDLNTIVVTPQQIYNEFSCGAQDITAIKDFMKMLYDKDGSLKYLLLFGDASFDYKNRIENNTNFVPSYESYESHSPTRSYVTDDYFGFLEDNESDRLEESVEIGIGRFPVKTIEEATGVVNKLFRYYDAESMGDWRNTVCWIADDEDSNLHLDQADEVAKGIDTTRKAYNVDKIYFDSFIQQSSAGGERYPEVKEAITRRVENGALIISYTGHGGEAGWAHERVLQVNDITGWTNPDRLPIFITATCEFSRFDDPQREAGGELVFLNDNGGGIALLTTTRLVFASPNHTLAKNFFGTVFKEVDGKPMRVGDIMRITKNKSAVSAGSSSSNHRNFTLLGDPAITLTYPEWDIETTHVNGIEVSAAPDTLKAFSKVTIKGIVKNKLGVHASSFNGTLYPTIFDKATSIKSLANDGGDKRTFQLQKNILYKGKVSVSNGNFEFTFVVPKDIAYSSGNGKISYYAENGTTDAHGYYDNFVIGGTSNSAIVDDEGPEIQLFMNDEEFVLGGITDETPILLALVSDSSGINTVGNGIGHDITVILDENTDQVVVLNDYYESELDSYQEGTVTYPFSELSTGLHTLTFKAWDVYNNSSEAYTEFVVAESVGLALSHVLNYPNPFSSNTKFVFEHNRPNEPLDVEVQVFTISGKLVKSISQRIETAGFKSPEIEWNGFDDYGDYLGRGVYIYRVSVTASSDGSSVEEFDKLVILR